MDIYDMILIIVYTKKYWIVQLLMLIHMFVGDVKYQISSLGELVEAILDKEKISCCYWSICLVQKAQIEQRKLVDTFVKDVPLLYMYSILGNCKL